MAAAGDLFGQLLGAARKFSAYFSVDLREKLFEAAIKQEAIGKGGPEARFTVPLLKARNGRVLFEAQQIGELSLGKPAALAMRFEAI
jgi:hypothetical protein